MLKKEWLKLIDALDSIGLEIYSIGQPSGSVSLEEINIRVIPQPENPATDVRGRMTTKKWIKLLEALDEFGLTMISSSKSYDSVMREEINIKVGALTNLELRLLSMPE